MSQVNLRTSSQRLAVIDRAAAIRGVSRTEFMLRSSEAAAIDVLSERPVIALGDEAWDDFLAALDAPVELDPAVKARYARLPQWERPFPGHPGRLTGVRRKSHYPGKTR